MLIHCKKKDLSAFQNRSSVSSSYTLDNFKELVKQIGQSHLRGFKNARGNLCFLNSVLQVLKVIEEFKREFICSPQITSFASQPGKSTVSIDFNYDYIFDSKF